MFLEPTNHDFVCLEHRLDLEQLVHPLKWNALGLGDQEVPVGAMLVHILSLYSS